ncbi:MAG: DUF1318 domain-containing protein [Myxococcota bacterium]
MERQLMGRLEPLTEEQLLAASVRAESRSTTGSLRELEDRAIAARRRQLFNRDDLEALAASGCVGEALSGAIVSRPCSANELLDQRERLLRDENADRDTIMLWAIEAEPSLTAGDLPRVRSVYHTLAIERALVGTPVQSADGKWVRKQ